jgi:hypothetical protein
MRRPVLAVLAFAIAIPGIATAKVDPVCSQTTMTSAIEGTVKDAKNNPIAGLKVELFRTNSSAPLADKADTSASGFYRICAGSAGGAGHDTYDVHVRDLRPDPLFAGMAQPYTTLLHPDDDLDFTPASGTPALYMSSLTITPDEISTDAGAVDVKWVVRSKAPASTTFKLTLGHTGNGVVNMGTPTAEGGGPAGGGWNRWTVTRTFAQDTTEALWWASAQGFDGSTAITQFDREPYTIDNHGPLFGYADSSTAKCGPGVVANGFSPGSPGTTNPQPVVSLGVCDKYSNGAKSGLDPFSLSGKICTDAALSTGCTSIDPVLNTTTIFWFPRTPMALGNYYFGFTIYDFAGNRTTTPSGFKLTITDRGGQTPAITAVAPGNLGSGATGGIIIGSSLTSPNSLPSVGFRVTDADGQLDLVPGTLRVRVYYPDERSLVYDYDPSKSANEWDPVTHKGGAFFDLSQGVFRATGYSLAGKPPGRYVATASITDHGGNTATMTWQWILAAAV